MEELFLMDAIEKDKDFAEAIHGVAKAMSECGIESREAAKALANLFSAGLRAAIREDVRSRSNNWRKMHGLPMRRRGGRRWR